MINGKKIIAFPGRDAYYLGLCPSFYKASQKFRDIYDEASNAIGEDLYKSSYVNENNNVLLHTISLISHCYAIFQLIKDEIKVDFLVGHSQGEFTAAACSGSIKLGSVIKLVYELEVLLMSSDIVKGKMVRVYELERSILINLLESESELKNFVSIGIYYSNNQHVLSGTHSAVDEISKLTKQCGARWVIQLNNQGAFHSPLCRKIKDKSDRIFEKYSFNDSSLPIYTCSDGEKYSDKSDIKNKLSSQIYLPVLWDKIVNNMTNDGVANFIELGPGSTLSGNTRINNPTLHFNWINTMKDLEDFISDFHKYAK